MSNNVYQFKRPKKPKPPNNKLGFAAVAALALGIAGFQTLWKPPAADSRGDQVTGCRVTDGDTIRCGDERIRLLAIDAPEQPGHCREGRTCAPGDPVASSENLATAMAPTMTINRVGTDRYGRTLAMLTGPKGDLSCWQLANDQAIYKADWDNGLRVARACPTSIF